METWIKTGIGFFLMLFGAEIVVRQELKRNASSANGSVDSGDGDFRVGSVAAVPEPRTAHGE